MLKQLDDIQSRLQAEDWFAVDAEFLKLVRYVEEILTVLRKG